MPMSKFKTCTLYWTPEIPDQVVIKYVGETAQEVEFGSADELMAFDPADPATPAFMRKAFGLDLVNTNPSTAAVEVKEL